MDKNRERKKKEGWKEERRGKEERRRREKGRKKERGKEREKGIQGEDTGLGDPSRQTALDRTLGNSALITTLHAMHGGEGKGRGRGNGKGKGKGEGWDGREGESCKASIKR